MIKHFQRMSWREAQLWALIFLTAITAVPQYVLQASLIAPNGITGLPEWFWAVDKVMWAVRAFVEPWVIVYLFTTRSTNWWQRVMQGILLAAEFGLLMLIIATVGPAFSAARLGIEPNAFFGIPWDWLLAAYTSLMMAGAGFAYRVQPEDIHTTERLEKMQEAIAQSEKKEVELGDVIETLNAEIKGLQDSVEKFSMGNGWFDALDPTNRARVLAATLPRESLPSPKILAEAWGVTPSTIVKAFTKEG